MNDDHRGEKSPQALEAYLGGLDPEAQDRLQAVFNHVLEARDSDLKPRQVRDIEPIRPWLQARYYNAIARNLFDYWVEEIVDFIEKGYTEWVLTGGIGTGKSTVALIVAARKLYELSCFEQPQRLFRLADMTKIFFAYLSVNLKQAELTGFGQFREQIDQTAYFRENYPRDPKITSVLRFPGEVYMIPGSDQISFIGTNLFGCILDEVNFLRKGGGGTIGDVHKAQNIYQEATDRRRSRFMYKGKDPGFSLLVSSSTVQTSFTASRIRAAQKGPGAKQIKVTNARLWEVKPKGTYSEKVFYVFNGSDKEDAFVIENPQDLIDLAEDPLEAQRLREASLAFYRERNEPLPEGFNPNGPAPSEHPTTPNPDPRESPDEAPPVGDPSGVGVSPGVEDPTPQELRDAFSQEIEKELHSRGGVFYGDQGPMDPDVAAYQRGTQKRSSRGVAVAPPTGVAPARDPGSLLQVSMAGDLREKSPQGGVFTNLGRGTSLRTEIRRESLINAHLFPGEDPVHLGGGSVQPGGLPVPPVGGSVHQPPAPVHAGGGSVQSGGLPVHVSTPFSGDPALPGGSTRGSGKMPDFDPGQGILPDLGVGGPGTLPDVRPDNVSWLTHGFEEWVYQSRTPERSTTVRGSDSPATSLDLTQVTPRIDGPEQDACTPSAEELHHQKLVMARIPPLRRAKWGEVEKLENFCSPSAHVSTSFRPEEKSLAELTLQDVLREPAHEDGCPVMDYLWDFTPPYLQGVISRIPMDFRPSFDGDLYTALKNIAGVSIAPAGKLFTSRGLWGRALDPELRSPFKRESFNLTMRGPDSILSFFKVDQFFQAGAPARHPGVPRYLRVDQSKNHDSTGIACVHRAGWAEATGVREPIIELDFCIRIQPPPKPDKIGFHKVRAFLVALRDLGMKVASITFDQYQSEDHMQLLALAHFKTAYLSVDKTDKPYLSMVNLLNEGRLRMYSYEPLRQEFFSLDHDREKGKVDHPNVNADGSPGSKDVADSVVGAIFDCISGVEMGGDERRALLDDIRTLGPSVQRAPYAGGADFNWMLPKEYRGKVPIEVDKRETGFPHADERDIEDED